MENFSETQYSKKYMRLYSALSQGDYSTAKKLLPKENQNFVQFIDDYISQHGQVRQALLRKADIPVGVGYKYLTGAKRTKNRNVILRLCIAMGMTLKDVQRALNLYGMSTLSENDRDSVIIAGIEHSASIDEIDEWLCSLSMGALMDHYDK